MHICALQPPLTLADRSILRVWTPGFTGSSSEYLASGCHMLGSAPCALIISISQTRKGKHKTLHDATCSVSGEVTIWVQATGTVVYAVGHPTTLPPIFLILTYFLPDYQSAWLGVGFPVSYGSCRFIYRWGYKRRRQNKVSEKRVMGIMGRNNGTLAEMLSPKVTK